MKIDKFCKELNKYLDDLQDEDKGVIGLTEELELPEITFTFNIACYLIAANNKLNISLENKTGQIRNLGRGGYTDISLFSKDKTHLFEIEHENYIKNKWVKTVQNLSKFKKAKYKVIIAYTNDKYLKEELINDFKKHTKNKKNFFLIYSNDDNLKDYVLFKE